MTRDNYQDDLFTGQFGQKKAKKNNFFDKYSEQRFLPYVRIPVEYAVIISIGILMLVIISYAVGVEMGKKFSEGKIVLKSIIMEEPLNQEKLLERAVPEQEILAEEPLPPTYASAPYVIQLVTFSEERSAQEEVSALRKKGFGANMARSGMWYQVYVGCYKTIDDAKRAKEGLNNDYKDCYIRKVGKN